MVAALRRVIVAAGAVPRARPVASLMPRWPALLPVALFGAPLAAALLAALAGSVDAAAWRTLWAEPALPGALALSAGVGAASTLVSLLVVVLLLPRLHRSPAWLRLQRWLGTLLAVPHAAFAVGFALLVMPAGLLARLVAPLAGWSAPPPWATVQDPAGLALTAALVLKEVPFLLWSVLAQWQRAGLGARLSRQLASAEAMGYSRRTAWARVVWPQLLPRLALPLAAVWAYGATVVDMALVLGPTRPPPLAVLAWQWLLDAEPQRAQVGSAAALLLALLVIAGVAAAAALAWASRGARRRRRVRGDRGDRGGERIASRGAGGALRAGALLYAAVLAMLVFASFAGVWTFPALWPQQVAIGAWETVAASHGTLLLTAGLGLATALGAVVLAVAWLEGAPAAWDAAALPFLFAPMLVPGVLLVAGQYEIALRLGLDGEPAGLWLVHLAHATPYALLLLAPAWRGFDPRIAVTAAALGRSPAAMLWHVKWPMLRAPLAAAFAVGFAVSVAQYLSTQFVGAGRLATITTEAVTLASGGQRTLLAAYALMQALLPALVFAAAGALGRHSARRSGAVA